VIAQRIRIVQASATKARMTAEHGETTDVGRRTVRAFPNPAKLARLSTINGLSETKLQRLRGVTEAALGGTLGATRLRSLPRSQALEELIAIAGIGPLSAELILLGGAGDPDFTPTPSRSSLERWRSPDRKAGLKSRLLPWARRSALPRGRATPGYGVRVLHRSGRQQARPLRMPTGEALQ
jgi:hypothetical protein